MLKKILIGLLVITNVVLLSFVRYDKNEIDDIQNLAYDSQIANYISAYLGDIDCRFSNSFDEIKMQISDINNEVSFIRKSKEIQGLYEEFDKMNSLMLEKEKELEAIAEQIKSLVITVDSLILLQESEMNKQIADYDVLMKDILNLQEKLCDIESKGAKLEEILVANIDTTVKTSDMIELTIDFEAMALDVKCMLSVLKDLENKYSNLDATIATFIQTEKSKQEAENKPYSDPQTGDKQDDTNEQDDENQSTIDFAIIGALDEGTCHLSVAQGQNYYYKIILFDECFNFELLEYTFEPSIAFFIDEQLMTPLELDNGTLIEPYNGYVYIAITSEWDDEIVFSLTSI